MIMNLPQQPPIVSIVIPTYNRSDLLKRCLDSVLAQTFADWQAIVINNFSEDDTVTVVQSFNDARITLTDFKNNGVIAASRNVGIRAACGKYIAFLDSDDTWMPTKLAKCIEALEGNNADVVCHAEVHSSIHGQKIVCYGPLASTNFESLLFKGNCLSTSAIVVKNELLQLTGGFSEDPNITTTEDYDLWLRLAKLNAKFVLIDEPLGVFFIHTANETPKVLERHLKALLCVLKYHYVRLDKKSIRYFLKMRCRKAYIYYSAAHMAYTTKLLRKCVCYGLKGFLICPFEPSLYRKSLKILLGH